MEWISNNLNMKRLSTNPKDSVKLCKSKLKHSLRILRLRVIWIFSKTEKLKPGSKNHFYLRIPKKTKQKTIFSIWMQVLDLLRKRILFKVRSWNNDIRFLILRRIWSIISSTGKTKLKCLFKTNVLLVTGQRFILWW